MQTIINKTLKSIDSVILNVSKRLPHNFPDDIVTSIVDGMRKASSKFKEKQQE